MYSVNIYGLIRPNDIIYIQTWSCKQLCIFPKLSCKYNIIYRARRPDFFEGEGLFKHPSWSHTATSINNYWTSFTFKCLILNYILYLIYYFKKKNCFSVRGNFFHHQKATPLYQGSIYLSLFIFIYLSIWLFYMSVSGTQFFLYWKFENFL